MGHGDLPADRRPDQGTRWALCVPVARAAGNVRFNPINQISAHREGKGSVTDANLTRFRFASFHNPGETVPAETALPYPEYPGDFVPTVSQRPEDHVSELIASRSFQSGSPLGFAGDLLATADSSGGSMFRFLGRAGLPPAS